MLGSYLRVDRFITTALYCVGCSNIANNSWMLLFFVSYSVVVNSTAASIIQGLRWQLWLRAQLTLIFNM